jgi:hypothetical protein
MEGKWFASVTTGFACEMFVSFIIILCPGTATHQEWIALGFHEWTTLKEVIQQMNAKYQTLTTTETCSSQADSYNHG